jgi:hypothetical protein
VENEALLASENGVVAKALPLMEGFASVSFSVHPRCGFSPAAEPLSVTPAMLQKSKVTARAAVADVTVKVAIDTTDQVIALSSLMRYLRVRWRTCIRGL